MKNISISDIVDNIDIIKSEIISDIISRNMYSNATYEKK